MPPPDDIGIPGLGGPTGLEAVPEPPPRERRRIPEGAVLLVWAILTVAATATFLWNAEQDELHDPVKKASRGEVTGLGPLSLVRADNMRKAFAAIAAAEPRGRVMSMRVDPTRISVDLRTPGFVKQSLDVDVALHVKRGAKGETTEPGLKLARLDPAAPERMLLRVNAKTKTAPTDLDYTVLTVYGDRPKESRWYMRLSRGIRPDQRAYSGNLAGRDVRSNG